MGLKRLYKIIKKFYKFIQEIQNHWFVFIEITLYGLLLGAFTFLYNFIIN